MQSIKEFLALKGIGQLTEKMVEIKKDVLRVAIATDKINAKVTNEYIYLVVTLALILSVATATLKRVDRKSTRLNSSHVVTSRMPSSA